MVAESIIICIDNSNYSKNADYPPSRLIAQREATLAIVESKLNVNPETTIGILTLANHRPRINLSQTSEQGAITGVLFSIESKGQVNIINGLLCAQLSLKHRINKNHTQRIILFVGSPLENITQNEILDIAKLLQRNNILLDIISFAEVERNKEILTKLYNEISHENDSHYIEITSSYSMVADIRTALFGSDADIDANDVELMMAIRLSLESERAREQALQQQTNAAQQLDGPSNSENKDNHLETLKAPTIDEINSMPIDDDLKQAMILSLQDIEPTNNTHNTIIDNHNTTKDNNLNGTATNSKLDNIFSKEIISNIEDEQVKSIVDEWERNLNASGDIVSMNIQQNNFKIDKQSKKNHQDDQEKRKINNLKNNDSNDAMN